MGSATRDESGFSQVRKTENPMPPSAKSGKQREIASALRGVMLTAATKSKCRFVNWSQFTIRHDYEYDQWIGAGLCQGLAAKYLDCVKRGVDFAREVDFNSLAKDDIYTSTALHSEVVKAAIPGNIGNLDDDDQRAVADFMKTTYGFTNPRYEKINPSWPRGTSRFATWVTRKSHYYMVSVPRHALAAVAANGAYHFFDPNCGIVLSTSGSHMRTFLGQYFDHAFTRKVYGKGSRIPFQAIRLS